MENVYAVTVDVQGIDFQYDELLTEWFPITLFKTMHGAQKYKERLYSDFCKEFPDLRHSSTEKHAAVWETDGPIWIKILIVEIYVND